MRSPLGPEFVPDPDAESCRFAVLGDCHSHRKSLRNFVEAASKRDVDFAVQLGDFVDYDEDIAYHHFLNRLGKVPFPLFLVHGNHEVVDFALHDSNRFCSYIPEPTTFFTHAGVLFGILDNAKGTFGKGCLEETRQHISAFREVYPDAPIVLFMHIPPTLDGLRSDDLAATATDAILDICDENDVDYLVCGHVHDHLEAVHGSTTILVDGCGGGSLEGPSTDVHMFEFAVREGELSFEQLSLGRDLPWPAKLDHLVSVTVPRHRWWFFFGACILLLRETWSLKKTVPASTAI